MFKCKGCCIQNVNAVNPLTYKAADISRSFLLTYLYFCKKKKFTGQDKVQVH